jgi:hypothetical protein
MTFNFGAISGYIKTHERLILVVLALALLGWVTNKGLNIYEGYEQGKLTNLEAQLNATKVQAAAAQQSAQDAKAAAQTTALQAAQDKAALAAMITALSQQNANLANQIIQRGKQTQQQQTADLNASIPDLTKRFQTLVPGVNPADVTISPDGKTATIGQDTAQKTVAQLELVPSLEADKTDLEQQVKNGQDMLASSQKALDSQSSLTAAQQKVIDAQDKYNGLLEVQLKQNDAKWQEQVNIEKTNTKKAYLKGFKWGAVFGFIGGLFVGHSF